MELFSEAQSATWEPMAFLCRSLDLGRYPETKIRWPWLRITVQAARLSGARKMDEGIQSEPLRRPAHELTGPDGIPQDAIRKGRQGTAAWLWVIILVPLAILLACGGLMVAGAMFYAVKGVTVPPQAAPPVVQPMPPGAP